jgi:hypothetical protein
VEDLIGHLQLQLPREEKQYMVVHVCVLLMEMVEAGGKK